MQKATNDGIVLDFFGAANGYHGFKSYFREIFSSERYERIFVLKGGPGTGKSSLMRKTEECFRENGFTYERILCSSDPHSLDGVIAEKGGKYVAILDGTAPHTRDAEIPGAIDEIIYLGNAWESERLTDNRKIILELNKKKQSNYRLAYEHLSFAGEIKAIKRTLESKSINQKSLFSSVKSLAESLSKDERCGDSEVRLISSFGRFGKYCTGSLERLADSKIKVKDCGTASEIFLSALKEELEKRGIKITAFPSVFDPNITEAIFLHESARAIILSDSDSADIFPEEFISNDPNISVPEETEKLYDSFLNKARHFFTFASDLHFELEKIYISSMHFDKNEELYQKVEKCVKKLAI